MLSFELKNKKASFICLNNLFFNKKKRLKKTLIKLYILVLLLKNQGYISMQELNLPDLFENVWLLESTALLFKINYKIQ